MNINMPKAEPMDSRAAIINAEAVHCVTYCRANNCDLATYIKMLADCGHWSREHADQVAAQVTRNGFDLDTAGEPIGKASAKLYYCAGPSCPGLPFKASQHPHPASCTWSDD